MLQIKLLFEPFFTSLIYIHLRNVQRTQTRWTFAPSSLWIILWRSMLLPQLYLYYFFSRILWPRRSQRENEKIEAWVGKPYVNRIKITRIKCEGTAGHLLTHSHTLIAWKNALLAITLRSAHTGHARNIFISNKQFFLDTYPFQYIIVNLSLLHSCSSSATFL